MNPCIASVFMKNVDPKTTKLQQEVIKKFNKSEYNHYSVLTEASHGYTMDKLIDMLVEKGHDAIMFLDIDCIPVNDHAIDYMFSRVYDGVLVGDAQRSNHIENNKHVFAGAHNVAFTVELYRNLGSPSFMPTHRGDVAEELTYKAEESNISVELLMPLRYDAPPIRMHWEPKNLPPYWDLGDGMPNFGIGTTYGLTADASGTTKDLFWHCWQIFHPGQQERFWNKCEELLNG